MSKHSPFCHRNNGTRRAPLKAGTVRYHNKVGLPSSQYATDDRMYRQPPKLKQLTKDLLRS
jgi:hypothetical protein